MKWSNPEPGIYTAEATISRDVTLEVFQPTEDDPDRYLWWVLEAKGGRPVRVGEAVGLVEAKRQCEEAAA